MELHVLLYNYVIFSHFQTGFALGAEAIIFGELVNYFDKHYSTANTIAQSGLSVGIMVMPLSTQLFIDIYGWRGAMLIIGTITLHLVVSGVLLIPVNSLDQTENPIESAKLHQKTGTKSKTKNSVITNLIYYLDFSLFHDANFVSMFIYNFGNGYCLTGWLVYLVPFAVDIGFPSYKAASLSTYGGIGNLLGNLIYLLLARKFSSNQSLICSTIIGSVALAFFPLFSTVDSYVGLLFASIVFGFMRGVAILSLFQIVRDGSGDGQTTNAVMWTFMSYSVGSVFSGFLSGWYKIFGFYLKNITPRIKLMQQTYHLNFIYKV